MLVLFFKILYLELLTFQLYQTSEPKTKYFEFIFCR